MPFTPNRTSNKFAFTQIGVNFLLATQQTLTDNNFHDLAQAYFSSAYAILNSGPQTW